MPQDADAWRTISIEETESGEKKFEAGAVSVETSLLTKLLEAVTQQQHELQMLRWFQRACVANGNATRLWCYRREHQEGMQAMQTHMEGVQGTLLQLNQDEQKEKEQNKEFRMLVFLCTQNYA